MIAPGTIVGFIGPEPHGTVDVQRLVSLPYKHPVGADIKSIGIVISAREFARHEREVEVSWIEIEYRVLVSWPHEELRLKLELEEL